MGRRNERCKYTWVFTGTVWEQGWLTGGPGLPASPTGLYSSHSANLGEAKGPSHRPQRLLIPALLLASEAALAGPLGLEPQFPFLRSGDNNLNHTVCGLKSKASLGPATPPLPSVGTASPGLVSLCLNLLNGQDGNDDGFYTSDYCEE